jgi:TM2 domain-containing membrane protein YozV
MYCSRCGRENRENARFCANCATPLINATVVLHSAKSPGLAAVLSFLWCGLGQIYNGQIGKGIAFLVAYLFSLILIIAILGIITTPILWIWGIVDAYNTAERLNREAGTASAL